MKAPHNNFYISKSYVGILGGRVYEFSDKSALVVSAIPSPKTSKRFSVRIEPNKEGFQTPRAISRKEASDCLRLARAI